MHESQLVTFERKSYTTRLCDDVVNSVESRFKMVTHVLFESASGYAIFEAKLTDNIGSKSKAVQESFQDLAKFGKMVSLMSFLPFKSAAQALENANDVSEGVWQCSLRKSFFD